MNWRAVPTLRGGALYECISVGVNGRISVGRSVFERLGRPVAVVLLRDDDTGAWALREAGGGDDALDVRRLTVGKGAPVLQARGAVDMEVGRYLVAWVDGMAVFGPRADEPLSPRSKRHGNAEGAEAPEGEGT